MSSPKNVTSSTTQFITSMKLRELRRQREKLREAYRTLDERPADERPTEQLRRLYDGLRGITFAQQSLHPEVVNLEILLREAEASAAPETVVALWWERLQAERDSGRLRAEFVYLFGALLEEWTRDATGDAALQEERARAKEEMLATALGRPEPNGHRPLLANLFDTMGDALPDLQEGLRKRSAEKLGKYPEYELDGLLGRLGKDVYQSSYLRREARRFEKNEQLQKELQDALTILMGERETWDWSPEGFTTRAHWARIRWRLYLNSDLPAICLLESLANRWTEILNETYRKADTSSNRHGRLRKLLTIGAPEIVVSFERERLRQQEQSGSLEGVEPADIWETVEESSLVEEERMEYYSILNQRQETQDSLQSATSAAYDGEYSASAANPVIRLVNAEVRLARAAFPDRPLYVVKADLRDFYARIPHDVLLTMLERLGVTEVDREFFARFLTPPLRPDGADEVIRQRRGVPMNFTLSALLADLLLRLMERYIRQGARVRIIRQIDDICLLTPNAEDAVAGWRRIGEFCAACGLEVNAPKSGAICLGGVLPEGLPEGLPRWGMVELDAQGEWRVHRATLDAYLERSRQRVKNMASLLSRVQAYNTDTQYLLNTLSLGACLGDTHRKEAYDAVREFHHSFFAQNRGIVAGLQAEIWERFPLDASANDAQNGAQDIPDAWIYWPLTAGGLGLKDPLLIAGQFAEAYASRRNTRIPSERDATWERETNGWSKFYSDQLQALEPKEPQDTRVMKSLVQDFIARGAEITAGRQTGLSSYWRWVLYTYGPQILQRFGTFRFLITELVPLQLISQQRVQDSSQSERRSSADFEDPFAE